MVFDTYKRKETRAWVSGCREFIIRLDSSDTTPRPYKILQKSSQGDYYLVGTSEELIKAKRSVCYRLNIPITLDLIDLKDHPTLTQMKQRRKNV